MSPTGTAMPLPPGQLASYAQRARAGNYEYHLTPDIYVWFVGNQKIVIFDWDKPTGHVVKLTTEETMYEKKTLARAMERQAQKKETSA